MTAYGDSSFAVSLFAQDANGEAALNLMRDLETPLLWTEWHDLEFENALELRVFRGEMTRAEQQSCVRSLAEAERSGGISKTPIDFVSGLARARGLVARHSALIGPRSFDVFHVALGLELSASHFLTFDARQKRLAAAAGMIVLPG